ncbi:hypothetical protein MtrunA17_Chr7g0271881 [Medicago truncatula]|uniref:Uncharacterized protein n=1 Tax=Medicago truncatula TaxID=3880 RepID=A0A396H9H2_MEDTR|nr:hypothetical protein MtrunA17_Chr7g0271881 [Medicago truncatula]
MSNESKRNPCKLKPNHQTSILEKSNRSTTRFCINLTQMTRISIYSI